MTAAPARLLVTAKAPVPGLAKTRLGAEIGMRPAAELAAAALLDTLEAVNRTGAARYLALTGDLEAACRGTEIRAQLNGWQVFEQHGETFADRLAHAHALVAADGPGPVVQIGMDTPQVTPVMLGAVVAQLDGGADVVLGPAEDGGWWVLGLADGADASALRGVPMSVPETYTRTVEAFEAAGRSVAVAAVLRDVDGTGDADAVAARAPGTRFARSWAGLPVGAAR